MAHFTCVGATVDELRRTLDRMRDRGLENVLALRGDPPQGEETWTKTEGGLEYSRELVELIARRLRRVRGRRGLLPGDAHPRRRAPRTTCATSRRRSTPASTSSSRSCSSTTPSTSTSSTRARAIGIDVPIIPGIMPITNAAADPARSPRCASREIPDAPARRARRPRRRPGGRRGAFGVAYATLQCADLLASGAPGIHFYTLNRSPATRAILSALKLLRPWERGGALAAGAVG